MRPLFLLPFCLFLLPLGSPALAQERPLPEICLSDACSKPLENESGSVEDRLKPGDTGFDHEAKHPYYQTLFNQGKCFCHTGECRPTVFQKSKTSPTGLQVLVNRQWVNVPKESILHPDTVPPELLADPAHVCAYPVDGVIKVECAIFPPGA